MSVARSRNRPPSRLVRYRYKMSRSHRRLPSPHLALAASAWRPTDIRRTTHQACAARERRQWQAASSRSCDPTCSAAKRPTAPPPAQRPAAPSPWPRRPSTWLRPNVWPPVGPPVRRSSAGRLAAQRIFLYCQRLPSFRRPSEGPAPCGFCASRRCICQRRCCRQLR